MRRALTRGGHDVVEAADLGQARSQLAERQVEMVITDVNLGSENGLDLVRELRGEGFDEVIVVMTAYGSVENAVEAMHLGADDYLQKPLSLEELQLQADKWLEQRRVAKRLRLYERMERSRESEEEILGQSPAWRRTMEIAGRLAQAPVGEGGPGTGGALPTILLLGETGAGKGVLARYIHRRAVELEGAEISPEPPFVHVNCSALPASLVEGELFGHEKGAFTDAREAKPGLFEMAEGGTIFLDEISEMPLELQSKLLLVVEQGTFRRVGGTRERSVATRVIAASNQALVERVEQGTFRRDLYYRLNTFTIQIPPLRERGEDAVEIARVVMGRFAKRYGRSGLRLSPRAEEAVGSHSWPGNVRELVNAVQRGAMLAPGPLVEPADLGIGAGAASPAPAASGNGHATRELVFDFEQGIHRAEDVERELMLQALSRTRGNVSKAAKLIGMQRSSFRYRIDRYGLEDRVKEIAGK